MKNFLLVSFLVSFCFISNNVWSQSRTITGKVTSAEDGSSLPGVNVIIKGTSSGTVTDIDGHYSVSVPESGEVLLFSFIGLKSQEININSQSVIDVKMSSDVQELSEVVVTAIGIEKDARKLGYSATKLDNQELTQGKSTSVLNSLQGKVAGAQISSSSGAPGSSNKVIIRGFTSLSGNNNPLYVIDGVPMNNSFTGDNSINGGVDFGSRINDINPEDIASMTVLKGAAATALYGSRAASGVIVITTKNGSNAAKRGKKAEISVASSVMFDNVLKLPEFQNERGQGFYGSTNRYLTENTSWGSKFTGKNQPWGTTVDGQQRVKPYSALEDNVKEFFETGRTFNNSVSLQGGGEKANYYVSYSNVDADGIMPTDADSYIRNTIAVRASSELSDKLRSSASFNYARTKSSFVPTGQGSTVYNNVLQTPRDISLLELQDLNNKFNTLENYYSPYTTNPWYILKEHGSDAIIDRFYGNVELSYEATDWLSFTGRVGSDLTSTEMEQFQPKAVIEGRNNARSNPGQYKIEESYAREFNTDLLMNINKDINQDINIGGVVGFNINQRESKYLRSQINDLVIPNFYNLSNTSNSPISSNEENLRRLYGLYGQVDFTYKNFLFLTGTARNDWSSTLPKDNRSFFYPGVNAGVDVTSALGIDSQTLSYLKVRGGWAQVGKSADPYKVQQTLFLQASQSDGFIDLNSPIAQSIAAYEMSNQIGNPNLQPEISTEIEFGADIRFFNNRIGLDATYYKRNVKENILTVPMTASTGYTSQVLNIAELSNEGIELLLTATPIRTTNFQWDISVNWSKNDSKILDLGGPNEISLGGLSSNSLIARVGGPAFEIKGSVPLTDQNGNIVVDAAGIPRPNPEKQVLGTTQYDWVGGLNNKLSYKGFSLSFTLDSRKGGLMYSRTASIGYFAGTAPQTLYNDRRPFIVPNSVVQAVDADDNLVYNDQGNPVYEENTQQISHTNNSLNTFWGNGGFDMDRSFFVSKSFVKLREVVLSYNLPASLLEKTPFGSANISLIGRNLLLWVPEDNLFIDPEQTTFGNDISSEFGDYGATPTTRSYGVSLRFTF
ncbi:SusC/RagA family TonB-linked outer membrane protein [Fulvivirga sediminis]|uniref:SusC/RagA family TonB-linked outer membrane protein n=1 Tax=Fulvivirga sediminis TaxID=2803949 RepID=A0A937F5M2_9BACT|nr:SusC/RagA family TonB-linked outer membrane protein [Fulvivirga sediminis]MBL3656867.1 SusC/RagA family TonB-linked outer membrane protein [Fulvivirga sediminis]